MKIRRKTTNCLNCGLTLNSIYSFCPRCGQENNTRMVSFSELLRDFFLNYFSFDTKFARSIGSFLFNPGRLTNLFVEGKRASYVNPLRLYIIISVVFFFFSSLLLSKTVAELDQEVEGLVNANPEDTTETIDKDSLQTLKKGWKSISAILTDETLSNEEALDSLSRFTDMQVDTVSSFGMYAFSQFRKVARQDFEIFTAYILQNMPVMMFVLLPVFAALLKLLYIRRNQLYVKHLIHGVHIHSFVFLLLCLPVVIYLLFDIEDFSNFFLTKLVGVVASAYIYISMLAVYKQKWFKTLIKFFLLVGSYSLIAMYASLVEAAISFFIF